jgi:hypothetical protein
LEPLPEPLVVYLAVNWAGHHYQGDHRLASVKAAASLVGNWDRARSIALEAGVSRMLEHALAAASADEDAPARPPLLHGRNEAARGLAWARTRTPARLRRAFRVARRSL